MSAIPPRFASAEVSIPAVKTWLDGLYEGADVGLLLTGPTGTGKTHQLWAIVRDLIRKGYLDDVFMFPEERRAYLSVPMLMLRLRPGGDDPVETITYLGRCGVLLLDDLGAEKFSEYVETTLHQILDTRYQWMRPTVFATNVPPAKLKEAIGDRLASRLAEMCVTVPVTGTDRRRA